MNQDAPVVTAPTRRRRQAERRALRLGFGGLLVLVGGLCAWSVLASVSGAVIAWGRVAVETRNQVVEHIDGGTVSEIRVREGGFVAKGEVLLRFSDTLLRSEETILARRYAELVARRNRLEAEYRGADAIAWDGDLAAGSVADPEVRDILDGQTRIFRARRASRAGEVARLRERIGQTRDEIAGLEARAVSLEQQGELIRRELAAHRELFEEGLTPLDRFLALQRAARNLEGQVGTNAAAIAGAQGRIEELEIQILQIDALRIERSEEQSRASMALETEVRERLASVRERLGRTEVRAPVSGEVFGMTVFTVGEVVRSGEPILHIVPGGAGMVVMADLDPIHVDQVYPGQEAVFRFSSFPARMTPEVEGHVVRVSADAVRDGQSGVSWYEVELAMGGPNRRSATAADASIAGGDEPRPRDPAADLTLTPGMPVEVHIRTGERSVISYLAKPLTDFFSRSMREE